MRLTLTIATLLAAFAMASTAGAATWDGGAADDLWTSADNWGGTAPVSPEALVFDGTTQLSNTNDFLADTPFDGITFGTGAGAFTLGGNEVQLGVGGIVNNSTSLQTIDLALHVTSGRTFDTASGDITLNGDITRTGGGSVVLTKEGAGTLTLNGAITANKATRVEAGTLAVNTVLSNVVTLNGGTVRLDGADVLASNTVINIAGGTLDLNGGNDNFRALNGSSGLVTNSNATAATLSINANASSTYGGTIEDGAGVVAVLLGQNTKTLTGNNTYTGGTELAGALALGSNTAIGTGDLTASANATVKSDSDTARTLTNNVSTAGTVTFGSLTPEENGNLSFGTLTRANNNTQTAVHNVTSFTALHGGGQLQKAGAGTLVIGDEAESTYTGIFRVDEGALLIDGDLSTMDGDSSTVAGATVGGSGTLGGNWTVSGTLSPGNSPGTLTVENDLTLDSGSTYVFEGGDLTIVGGTLDLGDDWTLALGSGFIDGGSVTLFTYDLLALDPGLAPTFDLTNLGFVPSGDLSLTDTGSSIVLNGVTLIPEPASLALLGVGGLMMSFRGRRGRRRKA